MAGTKAGSAKAVQTIYQRYGKDYFTRTGKLGGKAGTGHKFAHGKISAAEAGKLGKGTPRWSAERRAAHSQFMKAHWKARQPFVPDNSEFGEGFDAPTWRNKMINKLRSK